MYFFEHNLSIIGCFVRIIVVLTSTAPGLVRKKCFFLTRFSLFRRAMNRTPCALQACAEVCACDRTPLRERLALEERPYVIHPLYSEVLDPPGVTTDIFVVEDKITCETKHFHCRRFGPCHCQIPRSRKVTADICLLKY